MSNNAKKTQSNFQAALLSVSLDSSLTIPLHRQLADQLRLLVRSHSGQTRERLPSSRVLAVELSVSRFTVVTAIDQLISEGYLVARTGSGVFVAPDLPHVSPPSSASPMPVQDQIASAVLPFSSGIADARIFPYRIWARHLDAAWRAPDPALLQDVDPFGWLPLRQAIADHLAAWRGLECAPSQVVITSGSSEAFTCIAKMVGANRTAFVESPCYRTLLGCFEANEISCVLTPVDEEGLDPDQLTKPADAVVVTPSRQYPLGMTMPVSRRLAIVQWARDNNALIIEDDYDSEFRYQGQPPAALAGLDQNDLTVYVGSFSKLFSSTLRLGYFVVPRSRVSNMRIQLSNTRTQASLTPQPALARFMQSGEFATHVRRMRRIYAVRHKTLLGLIERYLSHWLIPHVQPTGMHVVCSFAPPLRKVSDHAVSSKAKRRGVVVHALSSYAQVSPEHQGLVLGFAAFDENQLETAALQLKLVLEAVAPIGNNKTN